MRKFLSVIMVIAMLVTSILPAVANVPLQLRLTFSSLTTPVSLIFLCLFTITTVKSAKATT